VNAAVNPRQLGPPVSHPVQIRLTGLDTETLFAIVDDVKSRLRQIPGAANVGDDWGKRTKKIVITVDQARARAAGASSQDVALSLQTIFSGFEVTQYREDEKVIPVTMRSADEERLDLDRLATVSIYAQASGLPIALGQIAKLDVIWEPSKILRRNSARSVSVVADVTEGTLAMDVTGILRPWLEEQSSNWPIGYRFEVAGEEEAASEANASIGAKLPIAAAIIVLLLVMQFNSLRRPLIILLTVPLGLTGVVIGLLVTRSYFGFMTLLGVISLFGIVINNAIVLIDRIAIEIDEYGRPPAEAVLSAAQTRLRPILLTTATTILGLLPLWLGGGPMWEPMAIAIIFGLGFATVLTLGVVPCLYAVFFRVDFRNVATEPARTT
jgi:multidrug efflux pump